MMTQTHMLVAAALFTRPGRPRQNAAVLLGAFVPDAAIYTLFIWSKLTRIPEHHLWNEIYFTEPMLTFTAIGNSFPLYTMFLATGIAIAVSAAPPPWSKIGDISGESYDTPMPGTFWATSIASPVVMFALAAMSHLAGDFPVHVQDAHPHFWHFTDWRFRSPVSYWDLGHHGRQFGWFEMALGVGLAFLLFRRYRAIWVRTLCVGAICAYAAVPLYFHIAVH